MIECMSGLPMAPSVFSFQGKDTADDYTHSCSTPSA